MVKATCRRATRDFCDFFTVLLDVLTLVTHRTALQSSPESAPMCVFLTEKRVLVYTIYTIFKYGHTRGI